MYTRGEYLIRSCASPNTFPVFRITAEPLFLHVLCRREIYIPTQIALYCDKLTFVVTFGDVAPSPSNAALYVEYDLPKTESVLEEELYLS